VLVLDVFSDFLVTEQKVMPQEWQIELHGLGASIERHQEQMKEELSRVDTQQ
jgi:hypothetical protein